VGSKSYTSSTTGVCTIDTSSGVVAFVSAGTCTISAAIASDGTYEASTSSSISFSVTKTPTSLALFTNMNKTLGDPSFTLTQPSVSPSITGTFTYTSPDILTVRISGSTATIVARGTATITAIFTPDDSTTYSSSTTTAILTVKQTPTFMAWADVSKYVSDSDFTVASPTTNGGVAGTYAYSSANTGVISLSGTSANAHIDGEGTSVITATFTPTETSFYNVVTTTMTITVTSSFSIGSIGPGGGKIFYYSVAGFSCGTGFTNTGSPTGGKCHYLEAAPKTWDNPSDDPKKSWAMTAVNTSDITSIANVVSPNTSSGLGLGYFNSIEIVNQGNDTTTAAGAARAYNGGSKSDWYLPTTSELNLLCQWGLGQTAILDVACSGTTLDSSKFTLGYDYWSSSEMHNRLAWFQTFGDNTVHVTDDSPPVYWTQWQGQITKDHGVTGYPVHVRPIRSF
jgi:hypothetical protein